MRKLETDIVVVGCGVAGVCAGLSAAENGAQVIVLERSSEAERGGNSRWTDANLLLKAGAPTYEWHDGFWPSYGANAGFHTDPSLMHETTASYDEWSPLAKTGPFLDPELLGAFSDNMPPTLEWLTDIGVDINMDGKYYPYPVKLSPLPYITGGGLEVIDKLAPRIEAKGGRFEYHTTAHKLLTDEAGRVCGLTAAGPGNEPVDIRAKAVVLASGGFQGNPRMLAQYVGERSKWVRPVALGGYYNKGEGLQMALDLNAATAGDWSDMHLQQVDPRSTRPEALVDIWQCGIVVNQLGERFTDECPTDYTLWQEEMGKAVLKQPGGTGYILYDEQLNASEDQGWRFGMRSEVEPYRADSLEELAAAVGIPADALVATVEQYNAACTQSDEVVYGYIDRETFSLGGQSTSGLTPVKSNYAKRIEKPPFFLHPMMSSICFTMGGLRVTPNAQVLNANADVIPGLYAAGETIGMHYKFYTPATSVLRGLIFGRIAGRHAATA